MRGKLIVMEGMDCSGKETQTKLLIQNLQKLNIQTRYFSFPNYESPTGRIIGGAYLGKKHIGESLFKEGAVAVDPKVSSLYFAADRKYNIDKIIQLLEQGVHVILDRYVYSNMAQQGCKIGDNKERREMYAWIEKLEFDLLELPKPDTVIFLYVPTVEVQKLMHKRNNSLDQLECNIEYLCQVERTYLELSKLYHFKQICCTENNKMRSKDDIQNDVLKIVIPFLKKNNQGN